MLKKDLALKTQSSKNFFIVVSGPTGVGKTDFVNQLSVRLPFAVEIINADVGQFYTPLAIGTAKPDYQKEPIPHHFFDIISSPRDLTVAEFRTRLITIMQDFWQRGVTPLIVGGSGFYVHSIFFPPIADEEEKSVPKDLSLKFEEQTTQQLWLQLNQIDPIRAQSIHVNDRYRIIRALSLWQSGKMPSQLLPHFEAPGTCAFYYLTREREELYKRIDERVDVMLAMGWLKEVAQLDQAWKDFLCRKKLIGYPDLIHFLDHSQNLSASDYAKELEKAALHIKSKTRAYAKRQLTFWRMLRKKLEEGDPKGAYLKKIEELNLTILPLDLYIERTCNELSHLKAT